MRFLKKVWDNEYWDLSDELKDIYNSLDEFQHQQIAQYKQSHPGMSLATALAQLPSVNAKLQWKAYNKGGQFKPADFNDPNTFKRQGENLGRQQKNPDWWKKYGY